MLVSLLATAAAAFGSCHYHGHLPDPGCTPGAIFRVAASQVCVPGYSESVRNVPYAVKREIYAEYGIAHHRPYSYEVDHLIPLELGGSNSSANLWPQPANPYPGYHQKDQLENQLHHRVCDGQLSLARAQRAIATNWVAAWRRYG